MNKLLVVSITIIILFTATSCGSSSSAPAAGTVEGKVHFNSKYFSASVHPCKVTEFSSGTSVVATDIDWSGIVSEGWSAAEGFQWQGEMRATGFTCTLDPKLKFELGKQIVAGDEKSFSILNVPSGKYALVVILTKPMGEAPQLVYSENNVPKVFDLTAEHGIDIGLLTINDE